MKSILASKKGQVSTLGTSIIAMVVAGVFLITGLIILQELRDTNTISTSLTNNGTLGISANLTVTGLGTFADFWEIIVLAIVISVVIGLLLVVFGGGSRR